MLGSIGMQEILVILLIVLLLFGAKRLPEIGRTLGKGIAQFRKAQRGISEAIEREVEKAEKEGEGKKDSNEVEDKGGMQIKTNKDKPERTRLNI